jgi:glycosyltransferase involved in cell wall biosynthesis
MADRARILLLIKGLGVGGAERLLEGSLPHLDRDRFDYRVGYLLPWKTALVPAFVAAGVPVHDLNMRTAGDPRVLVRLVALLRRERIDLIHAHLPVAGIWGRVAARLAGVPCVVYTEHNVPQRYASVTRTLNRRTYRMNDVVIAVSDEVRREIGGYANGRPAIVTIQNAVDAAALGATEVDPAAIRREFGFPPDALLVTTVGNLTAKKGHTFLLAAAARVVAQHSGARFLLVGQGPLADSLHAEASHLGLNGTVVFAGFRQDAVRILAASDLFVLSSVFEGLPVTLLEAMALGKPSVVTRVGGIPEITDESSSVLVEPGDPEALAAGISGLLEVPALRDRMGAAAREKARSRYGVPQMVAAVEQVYRDLLQAKRT